MQKFRVFSVLALAFCAAISSPEQASAKTKKAGIEWVNDYNMARALAKGSGRPMFLVFGADRCGWCRELKETVFAQAYIQNEARQWIFSYFDTDGAGDALGQKFEVSSLPTLFFCAPNGGIVERVDGFIPANQILLKLRRIRAAYGGVASRPVGKTLQQRTAKRTLWHEMPEIRGALKNPKASGVFLLSNDGPKRLVVPPNIAKKSARKTVKKPAKKTAKMR